MGIRMPRTVNRTNTSFREPARDEKTPQSELFSKISIFVLRRVWRHANDKEMTFFIPPSERERVCKLPETLHPKRLKFWEFFVPWPVVGKSKKTFCIGCMYWEKDLSVLHFFFLLRRRCSRSRESEEDEHQYFSNETDNFLTHFLGAFVLRPKKIKKFLYVKAAEERSAIRDGDAFN